MATSVAELEKRVSNLEAALENAVRRLAQQSDAATNAVASLRQDVSKELQKLIGDTNEAFKKVSAAGTRSDRY